MSITLLLRDLTSLFDFTAGHTVHLLESYDSPDTWNLECAAQLNVTLCIVIIITTIIIIVVIIVTIIIIDTSILLYSSSKICLRPRFLARITALYLVELQNTWKELNRTMLERPAQHMLYIWKAGDSRMSNMTFPCVNPIQLVPTMKKELFTSSFQAKLG